LFKEVITVYSENHREPIYIYAKKVIDYNQSSFPVLGLLRPVTGVTNLSY
jgi:hypothetical protein